MLDEDGNEMKTGLPAMRVPGESRVSGEASGSPVPFVPARRNAKHCYRRVEMETGHSE